MMSDHWEKISNRETVKTLLAMGFIPTWLEELLDYGDLINSQANDYVERNWDKRRRLELIWSLLLDLEKHTLFLGGNNYPEEWNRIKELSDLSIKSKGVRTNG